MTVAAWILAVLGAVGGVLWLQRVGRAALRLHKLRRLPRRSPKDFAYKSLEIGARVYDKGSRWEVTRSATVRSLREGLAEIDIGVRPLNQRTATYNVKPQDTLQLLRRPDRIVGYDFFAIKPRQSLNADQELQFTFVCNFEKQAQKDDFLTWASNRRVDRLRLRVLFPDGDIKVKVKRQIVSQAGHVLEECDLHPDPVTGEYRLEETDLSPTAVYSISWTVEEP